MDVSQLGQPQLGWPAHFSVRGQGQVGQPSCGWPGPVYSGHFLLDHNQANDVITGPTHFNSACVNGVLEGRQS